MRLKIDTQDREQEGCMFDVERARGEGLFEEFRLFTTAGVWADDTMQEQLIEIPLDEEQMKKLHDVLFDISANLEPGREVREPLIVKYRYGYTEKCLGDERKAA